MLILYHFINHSFHIKKCQTLQWKDHFNFISSRHGAVMESRSVSGCQDSFPLKLFLLQQSRIMLGSMEYLFIALGLILRSWLLSQYRVCQWMEFMSVAYFLMVLSGTDRRKYDRLVFDSLLITRF